MRKQTIFGASVLVLASATSALGQTIPPVSADKDAILIIGSRTALLVGEVTGSANIIPGDELDLRGDVFLADALRRIPGAAVNRSGQVGGLTQVRLRGAEANHVLVLIDGMQSSNPFTGGFDFAGANSAGVSRIDILRGEQSALWGSDAIGGVIHISTEPDGDAKTINANLEAGSLNTYAGSVSAFQNKDKYKIWGNVSVFDTQGYDVSGQNGETDGFSNINAIAGANIVMHPNWTLQIRGRVQDSDSQFDADTDFDGRLNDVDRRLYTDQIQGRLALIGDVMDGHVRHQASISYLDSRTRSGASRSVGNRTKIGWQTSGKWQTGSIAHRIVGVVEGQFEGYENDGGTGAGQNQKKSNDMWSGAVEYALQSGPLVISASARHDENTLFANSDAFRGGVAWHVEPLNGKFHASIGQGVKNPGFFELFGFFPAFFVGNPNLVAEKSTGFELGWDQQFDKASLGITFFSSHLENEIYTDFGVSPATAKNRAGKSKREGIELSAAVQPMDGLRLNGSVSFLRADEAGVQEVRRPEFLASLSAFWQDPSKKWQLSVGIDHNGKMLDTDWGTFQRVNLSAFTLVRAKATYKIDDNISVYVRGENLGNAAYSEVFGYQGQERTIYGGVSASF